MIVAIDSNSLISLVRYYLPFDIDNLIFDFLKQKIEEGVIVIIDKVLTECTYNSKGIVLKKLDFLNNKPFLKKSKTPYKTQDLIAPAPSKFLRQVENQFVNNVVRRQKKLTDTEFESQKNSFLQSADMKLIIFCLNLIKNTEEEIILVTEETEASNDNKLFKKIPAICRQVGVKTMTLPDFLKYHEAIEICLK